MMKIIDIKENLPSTSEYNAVLVIARLKRGRAHAAPTGETLPAALPFLLSAFEAPRSTDPIGAAAADALRVRRFDRHPRTPRAIAIPLSPIAVAIRPRLIKDMMDLVQRPKEPAGRTADGHQWMRRMALETLWLAGQRWRWRQRKQGPNCQGNRPGGRGHERTFCDQVHRGPSGKPEVSPRLWRVQGDGHSRWLPGDRRLQPGTATAQQRRLLSAADCSDCCNWSATAMLPLSARSRSPGKQRRSR